MTDTLLRVRELPVNYYGPRQIETGPNRGRWHYCVRNGKRTWPIGYCSKRVTCPACDARCLLEAGYGCPTCDDMGVIKRPQPCPGHDTELEACEHYTAFLLDERLRLNAGSTTAPCQVCHADTLRFAAVDTHWAFDLCPEHMTREHVAALLGVVGQVVSSF